MSNFKEQPSYSSIYAKSFNDALLVLPDVIYERIEHVVDLLENFPNLGRPYNPDYDAALPPIDCMQMFVNKTHCVLYYTIDERNKELVFFYLGDTRQNPLTIFDDIDI
ncbi:hypothetical protein [Adlercreutzia sp. ZJ154]|uniref:hypothetical protein n=1 Tax=Adlercreutzia sp. ZJ154 TaxID=2709790 RepID=UPI0013ECDED8|nr:hypothetical protein [Adlercreutzia sp. ZJ154]